VAGGDVEQGVARLDEVGLKRAERRLQLGVDVGGLGRGGAGHRPGHQQHGRRRQQRAGAAARAALAGALLLAGCARQPAPPSIEIPPPLEAGLSLPDTPICPEIEQIEVRKSERRLVARCSPGPSFVMKVALGREPLGPKTAKGDNRTPEGSYVVSGPAIRNRFHRFIPIDYPSRHDADVGLQSGTISAAEHARIVARRDHDRTPPQDTVKVGTPVWIVP
jgi:hypothetical protein